MFRNINSFRIPIIPINKIILNHKIKRRFPKVMKFTKIERIPIHTPIFIEPKQTKEEKETKIMGIIFITSYVAMIIYSPFLFDIYIALPLKILHNKQIMEYDEY